MLLQKLAAYKEKRANSNALPSGSAPYTSSNFFRIGGSETKTTANRCDHWFSLEALRRQDSALKASASLQNPLTTISLGTGRPAPQFYPWELMVIHGTKIEEPSEDGTNTATTLMHCSKVDEAYDLGVAMNFGYSAGSPQVLRFVTEHVEMLHSPPYKDWETCLTCSTTPAIEMALRIFCNKGDYILTEAYTYSGILGAAEPLGLNIVGVEMDTFGLVPENLDLKLRTWDTARGRRPFVLYMIPCGQNPTGTTQTLERRRAIYEIAERHDLLIIEDDPYYFLQLGTSMEPRENGEQDDSLSERYVRSLPASYLSLDTSGRVLRLETTSKILAPGLRCGWATGCTQIIRKFLNHIEFSTVAPSGPSQLMLYKLLDEAWGHEGFIRWLTHISLQYRQRRDILLEACTRHLPKVLCHWDIPAVGMFAWIQIDWRQHPAFRNTKPVNGKELSLHEIEDRIYNKSRDCGVQIAKGSWFAAESGRSTDLCFRMTFAAAAEDALSEAVARFGKVLRAEFLIT